MGKIITTSINKFWGGISEDIREVDLTKFSISKHFDTITNPKKLIPYRDLESESFTAGLDVGNFLYNSSGQLCALGKDSGQTWFEIYYKSDVTSGFGGGRWEGSQGIVQYKLFVEFNGKMYLCQFVTPNYEIVSALIASPYTVNEAMGNLSAAPTGQGLVHSKANTLFIPCGNKIDTVDSEGTLNNNVAPSISSNLSITSLSEWGSYLAIGCRDTTGGNSKVIIWDMVSTTTFIDIIDFGRDSLYVLNYLSGYLIGISSSQSTGAVFGGDFAKLSIYSWAGGKTTADLIKEVCAQKLGTSNPSVEIYEEVNFVKDNRLYFAAKIDGGSGDSPRHIGIWSVGKKNINYPFSVNFEMFATNDNSETQIMAAICVGSIWWFVHTALNTVTRTNDQQSYLVTSIYESQKFNGELHGYDSSYIKNLMEASLTCDKLPTDATATLKYRIDGEISWTPLLTISTTDRLSEFINIGIGDYKEIEWRIESYRGAKITGFSFTEEVIGKKK